MDDDAGSRPVSGRPQRGRLTHCTCGATIAIGPQAAGRIGRCGGCGRRFRAPGATPFGRRLGWLRAAAYVALLALAAWAGWRERGGWRPPLPTADALHAAEGTLVGRIGTARGAHYRLVRDPGRTADRGRSLLIPVHFMPAGDETALYNLNHQTARAWVDESGFVWQLDIGGVRRIQLADAHRAARRQARRPLVLWALLAGLALWTIARRPPLAGSAVWVQLAIGLLALALLDVGVRQRLLGLGHGPVLLLGLDQLNAMHARGLQRGRTSLLDVAVFAAAFAVYLAV